MHDERDLRTAMLPPTIALLTQSTRSVALLAARTGRAGARVILPGSVAEPVNRMLSSLRSTVEHAPHLSDEIDVLMDELAARRLSIQAVTAELSALDEQLSILERTLTPVQTWSAQLLAVQHSLLHPTGVGGAVDEEGVHDA